MSQLTNYKKEILSENYSSFYHSPKKYNDRDDINTSYRSPFNNKMQHIRNNSTDDSFSRQVHNANNGGSIRMSPYSVKCDNHNYCKETSLLLGYTPGLNFDYKLNEDNNNSFCYKEVTMLKPSLAVLKNYKETIENSNEVPYLGQIRDDFYNDDIKERENRESRERRLNNSTNNILSEKKLSIKSINTNNTTNISDGFNTSRNLSHGIIDYI